MYKIFSLIIILLFTNSVYSLTLNNDDDDDNKLKYSITGFTTLTIFSQNQFYDNTASVALNLDLTYNDYAVRTQFSVDNDINRFNRFTIEKSIDIDTNKELLIKLGRFPRLVSFYNNLTDSPGTYEVAMIPLGVYTRRLLKSQAFNAIDGVSILYTLTNPEINNKILKFYLNYGQVPLDNQCIVQQEYRYDKCLSGYKFKSDIHDYDVGVSYEINNLTFIASNTNIQFKTELINPNDPVSNFLVKRTNRLIANVTKLGFKYNREKYLLQGEYSYHNYSVNNSLQNTISIHKENTSYILAEYRWQSNFSTNIQYSYGSSLYLGQYNDKSIGMTYILDNTTLSLEYHSGYGVEWKKYLATSPYWNSVVFTASYTF